MTKRKKHHILLIDDDIPYCEVLKKDASEKAIIISYFHNLEDGIYALKESKKYKAVILDGRCILNKEQEPGSGKKSFVFHAMQKIRDLVFERDRYLPLCINAESPEEFIEELDGIAQVFKKNKQHPEMISYLLKMIHDLPEVKIRQAHEKVFLFLEEYCNETDEDLVEDLILNMEKSDESSIISNLSIIRRLEEKVYDVLCIKYLKKDLHYFDSSRGSRTKAIISHLQQSNDFPIHLIYLSKNIYSTCSKYGNHNEISNHRSELPGKYLVKTFLNALLEIIVIVQNKIENQS